MLLQKKVESESLKQIEYIEWMPVFEIRVFGPYKFKKLFEIIVARAAKKVDFIFIE